MNTNTKAVQEFLSINDIKCNVKYISKGSMKNTYRLWNRATEWNIDLANKLNNLGIKDFDSKPLSEFSGNGGAMHVFVKINTNKKIPIEF